MVFCCNDITNDRISNMIDELELMEYQKTLLKNRFLDQVVLYNKKAKTAEFFYILFNVFMTVGSIVLPALLSIQQMDYSEDDRKDERIQITIYWLTWIISLVITICNGLIQLLGLNKQYLSYTRTKEKMLSEGWYYFQLTGDYMGTSHKESFHEFCEEIEKIKEEQVDKELSFMASKKKKQGEHTPSMIGSTTDNNTGNVNTGNVNTGNVNNPVNINIPTASSIPRLNTNLNNPVNKDNINLELNIEHKSEV
mgnify:CR=1 FL=1